MADDSTDIPIYSANFVMMTLNTDEFVLELRRIIPEHTLNPTPSPTLPGVTVEPGLTPAQILAVPPIARVVLTFSATRALKDFLDNAFPAKLNERKGGQ